MSTSKVKQPEELFFPRYCLGSLSWACGYGETKEHEGSFYTNSCFHLSNKHATELNDLSTNQINWDSATNFLLHKNFRTALVWIEIVVDKLLPFLFAESATARQYSNIESIPRSTFTRYVQALAKNMEQTIISTLPE